MALKKIILVLGILALLFAFVGGYFYFLISIDYGVMDYNEYYGLPPYNKTPCEIKQLGNGWTQLENCEIYKKLVEGDK